MATLPLVVVQVSFQMPIRSLLSCFLLMTTFLVSAAVQAGDYATLVQLRSDWRHFEHAPLRDGAPDYSAPRIASAHQALAVYQRRLAAIETTGWTIEQQVDWHLLRAEMNGFDFNCRVLKPWERDPAFYLSIFPEQSDVPAHEGPTNHALVDLWTYDYPLDATAAARLEAQLATIGPLLTQARVNLRGNARDLWLGGIHTMQGQVEALDQLAARLGPNASPTVLAKVAAARAATVAFVDWLQQQVPSKTGPSGIGIENYNWYQRNVRYVPLTWEDERRLLERELTRAWSSLVLEETGNQGLPPLVPADTPLAFAKLSDAAASRLMDFLRRKRLMPVTETMEPALRLHLGTFVPAEKRNFFEIGRHLDPVPLYSHFYHWFDLARYRDIPPANPFRRSPLLYNIFDSNSEGTATAVEEMYLHAGLYDDSPRSREIVWVMLAARAARGLGSLYAHANQMTMEEAGRVHVDWTPRGWMKIEPNLLRFEQHLYLRQPGYGTSYIAGKYQFEKLMAEQAKRLEKQGKPFVSEDFFREYQAAGAIPIVLVRWQMTGQDDEVRALLETTAQNVR